MTIVTRCYATVTENREIIRSLFVFVKFKQLIWLNLYTVQAIPQCGTVVAGIKIHTTEYLLDRLSYSCSISSKPIVTLQSRHQWRRCIYILQCSSERVVGWRSRSR